MEKLTFWKTNFPNIKRKNLTRFLYNNHSARLETHIFAGRILVSPPKTRSTDALQKEIEMHYWRNERYKNARFFGINKNEENLDLNVNLLKGINQLLIDDKDIKLRVIFGNNSPYNRVFFSASTLKQLEPIAKLFKEWPEHVISISIPNGKIYPAEENGTLLRKRKPKYAYRITLRFPYSRTHNSELRNKLADMINNTDELKMSEGTEKRLRGRWCWGDMHLYTNDPSYVTFIQLIAPSAVKKISPIVQIT